MKEIQKGDFSPVFQGDVMIMRIPSDRVAADVKDLGHSIIAHSETGHHHIANNATVLGGLDPMVMFMKPKAEGPVDIVHHRDFDTHETIRFYADEGDAFIIKRQREWRPEGWAMVAD